MMPPINPRDRIATPRDGVITAEFNRWLQLVRAGLHGPFIGEQLTGTININDGQGAIQVKRLTLTGSQRVTIRGTGRLVVCG